jgi:hypothetical protein
MVRHDMQKVKEDVKSTQIRASLGIRYPHEIQADRERAELRRLEAAKKQVLGAPLGLEEE